MKTQCSICSSPMRTQCPALNASLCGSCCASKRNITIQCSSDCRFNPLSLNNYDTYLRVNKDLNFKAISYLSNFYTQNDVTSVIHEMLPEGEPAGHDIGVATDSTAYYLTFCKVVRNGKTAADLWEEEGWTDLNTDEIAIMRFRRQSLAPTLIEVQKVLDHQTIQCLDLLNPERGTFHLIDRTLTKTVFRYTHLLAWLTNYPFYSRAEGDPVDVPVEIFEQTFKKITAYLTKECFKKGRQVDNRILGEKFGELLRWIRVEARKSQQENMRGVDYTVCWASYAIKTSKESIKQILDAKQDFRLRGDIEPDEAPWPGLAYNWCCLGESKAIESKLTGYFTNTVGNETIVIFGGVLLGDREIVVHSVSKVGFDYIKKMAELYFKDQLAFRQESITERAQQIADKATENSERTPKAIFANEFPSGSRPFSDEERKVLVENYRRNYEKFLHAPIRFLNNMTPVEAVKNNEMRPKVIELMKQHIHSIDVANRRDRLTVDISWVLGKLGLVELML